ncbi:39S ribosomal protein L21, mitochondrial-like [Dreissena polymorpha]|nr:39S ribosomal protein L21, mitochondrial-like [Dreissena polymorpha]
MFPAAIQTGQYTCRTMSAVARCLHTFHGRLVQPQSSRHGLVVPKTCMLQQTCNVRKIYPNPFEQDPEYNRLPDEYTHFNLDYVPHLGNKGQSIVSSIQASAAASELGRLFAVVHVDGQQRKVTTEDLLLINGFFPPQIGDKIRLEKVMLVGGRDFTLMGKPILKRDLVNVEATVIEKTMSHVRVNFTMLKRFRRLKLVQHPQAVIVINKIELHPSVL